MLKNVKNKPGRIVIVLLSTLAIVYVLIGIYNTMWGSSSYITTMSDMMDGDDVSMMVDEEPMMFETEDLAKDMIGLEVDIADEKATVTEKKVIKSGSIDMKVNNLEEGRKDIEKLVADEGGLVTSLNESGTDNDRIVSATIKVPAESFDDVMQTLRGMAVEVDDVYTYSDDVTEQYVDTAARLANEEAYEAELVALLGDAADVDDVLAVRTELNKVRANIESLTASINYYDRNSDMSSITVSMTLYEGEFDVATQKWSPFGVAKSAVDVLLATLMGIANILIWLVVFSPLVLLLVWVKKGIMKKKMKMHKKMKEMKK